MNSRASVSPQRSSFNLFALPSDTDVRFILLIVTAVAVSLWYFYILTLHNIPVWSQHSNAVFHSCFKAAFGSTADIWLADPSFTAAIIAGAFSSPGAAVDPRYQALLTMLTPEVGTRFTTCMASIKAERAALIALGAIVLLGTASAVYWVMPAWKMWRARLVPLSEEDAPELIAYIADLCHEIDLSHPPILVWNPLNPTSGALVFGRMGRYYLSLTGGLVTQFYTDRPAFRAVMLHELAHLHNRDIDKTYFTIAVWLAFMPIVIGSSIMVVLLSIGSLPLSAVALIGWDIAILVPLVYLTRNAVLRSREVYADARAVLWDGPQGALGRVLASLPHVKGGRWRSLMMVHPNPLRRRQIVDDPTDLFHLGFWDAVGTGAAIAIARPALDLWLGLFPLSLEHRVLVVSLICSLIGIGILGAGLWRTVVVALIQGRSAHPDRLALGFVVGLTVGEFLFFSGGSRSLLLAIGGPIFSLIVTIFVFRWIVSSASAWFEVAVTPRLIYLIGLLIAGGLLAVSFGVRLQISQFVETIGSTSLLVLLAPAALIVWLMHPLATLLLVALWAFPLAIWLWRRWAVAGHGSRQEIMDSTADATQRVVERPLALGRAVKAGLVGGAIFCILLLVIRVTLRFGIPEATQATVEDKIVSLISHITGAVLVQISVAALIARKAMWLGTFQGLLAAFTAGCLMTIGMLGVNLLVGGGINGALAWQVFSQISNWGALLSLAVAASVAALASRLRQRSRL